MEEAALFVFSSVRCVVLPFADCASLMKKCVQCRAVVDEECPSSCAVEGKVQRMPPMISVSGFF